MAIRTKPEGKSNDGPVRCQSSSLPRRPTANIYEIFVSPPAVPLRETHSFYRYITYILDLSKLMVYEKVACEFTNNNNSQKRDRVVSVDSVCVL